MSKETYYFSHDYNVRSDKKIKKLLAIHGYLGYGLFWAIIEDLYNNENNLPLDYESISFDLRADVSIVKSIINDFDLFLLTDCFFYSESVKTRLNARDIKSAKARESINKRWSNTNVIRTNNDSNTIKESKVKESKVNIIKEIDKENSLWTENLKNFINDFRWKEKFCRDKSVSIYILESRMNEFIKEIELREDYKNTKELKSHFVNWFNKNQELFPINNLSNKQHSAPPLKNARDL